MKLTEDQLELIQRGWHPQGAFTLYAEIKGKIYVYNTEDGVLTCTDSEGRLVQTLYTVSQVINLGISDTWHEPMDKLERMKLRLEHMYHLCDS